MSDTLTTIRDLKARAQEHYDKARKLNAAVKAIQDSCEHKSEYAGHGHKDDYYRCPLCDYEWSE